MRRRTGIYPGTFDPVHPGHLAFAMEALRLCQLDEVVFLPEQRPRNKSRVTALAHRIAMLQRATTGTPGLRTVQLASEQFTVQRTLPELRRLSGGSRLTFLIGSDIARQSLPYWKDLALLLPEISLAIGLRADDDAPAIATVMRQLSRAYNLSIDYTCISTPEAGLASSQIRSGTIDTSRLHPSILDYMQEHQLYA